MSADAGRDPLLAKWQAKQDTIGQVEAAYPLGPTVTKGQL